MPLTIDALRTRFESDDDAPHVGELSAFTERMTRALRRIGWGGVDSEDPEEVAGYLYPVVASCVHAHRDLAALHRDVAELLRNLGPRLDGSMSSASAYLPAAQAVIERYVEDEG